jgi:hypothetical protein
MRDVSLWQVKQRRELKPELFGEGVTVIGDTLIQVIPLVLHSYINPLCFAFYFLIMYCVHAYLCTDVSAFCFLGVCVCVCLLFSCWDPRADHWTSFGDYVAATWFRFGLHSPSENQISDIFKHLGGCLEFDRVLRRIEASIHRKEWAIDGRLLTVW